MDEANTFIESIQREILSPIITLLSLAAFLLFVWGVVEFIRGADSEEKRKIGQQHMLWGIVGLVIIFGANALVGMIQAVVDSI